MSGSAHLLWQRSWEWQNQTSIYKLCKHFVRRAPNKMFFTYFQAVAVVEHVLTYTFSVIALRAGVDLRWWALDSVRHVACLDIGVHRVKWIQANTKGVCMVGAQCLNENLGTRVIDAQYQPEQQQATQDLCQCTGLCNTSCRGCQGAASLPLIWLTLWFLAEPCVIPT